jgi:aspartate ammonia-lyase
MYWKDLLSTIIPLLVEPLIKTLISSLTKHKGIDNSMAKVMIEEIGKSDLNDINPLTAESLAKSLDR